MAALTNPLGNKESCEEGERPASIEEIPPGWQARAADDERAIFTRLTKTIEGEIIPRLLLAHKATPSIRNEAPASFDPDELQEFAGLILGLDGSRAQGFIQRKRGEGRPLESIILGLLAPAASYLGALWNTDRCSFAEVAVGLSRLRQLLVELSPAFESETPGWHHGRRALLLPTPGEQHTFGLFVVEAFFRREGWDVCGGLIDSGDEISHLVERQWFAIAGFSLSSERFLDRLTFLIRAVRQHSCNPEIGVLVGGPLFLEKPELAAAVGADASAADGRIAVQEARTLLAQSTRASMIAVRKEH